jgi:hypothetical protein
MGGAEAETVEEAEAAEELDAPPCREILAQVERRRVRIARDVIAQHTNQGGQ